MRDARIIHLDEVIGACEAGKKRICRGAPHIIFAHSHKDSPGAEQACTIGLTYLEIAASAMGLGACWGGFFGLAASTYPSMSLT